MYISIFIYVPKMNFNIIPQLDLTLNIFENDFLFHIKKYLVLIYLRIFKFQLVLILVGKTRCQWGVFVHQEVDVITN